MKLTHNEYRAVALALIDEVFSSRSEKGALWVAGMDSEAFRYYARHHGLIERNGKVNPIKVNVLPTSTRTDMSKNLANDWVWNQTSTLHNVTNRLAYLVGYYGNDGAIPVEEIQNVIQTAIHNGADL